jgi:hypothetical protein
MVFVMPATVPVKAGLLMVALKPIAVVTLVLKLASFPNASASSFNVSNAAGD